ncbi:MAG TPA: hypothetical protein PLR25_28170 [Planctomycetaceae bacterium]|nr:hypothetical protein [Planctomycetaceae bacterium]
MAPAIFMFGILSGLMTILRPAAAKRFAMVLLFIAVPLSVFTYVMFAMKLGRDIDPDPFNPQPWPPFWLLIALFGVCAAITAVAGKIIARRAMCPVFGIRPQESADYVFHSGRAHRLGTCGQKADELAVEFKWNIDRFDRELASLVSRCLAALASGRAHIDDHGARAAHEARADVMPVPEIIQYLKQSIHHPSGNGRVSSDMTGKPR